jgi:hypothetical protein
LFIGGTGWVMISVLVSSYPAAGNKRTGKTEHGAENQQTAVVLAESKRSTPSNFRVMLAIINTTMLVTRNSIMRIMVY